jgi:hypothetical protein
MHEGRRVSPLLLAALFSVSLAFGCGNDDVNAHPGSEPCAAEACMPDGGHGGSAHDGGDGGIGDRGAMDSGTGNGGAADGATAHGDSADGSTDGDVTPPGDPPLEERIDEAVASIQSDTCFAQDDTSLCQWADYQVGPAQFNMAKSTGEAVLVIDDFGAGFFPELVRYRNRLLGFYRINGEKVEAQVLSVHLPKRLGDVLVSFAGPEFIPARALASVGLAAGSTYRKLNVLYYGHGGVVFGHMVELVPEQPLLLLDLSQLLDIPPAVCAGIDGQTLAAASAHFAAIAASLKQVMTDHDVRFINASFGSTALTLAGEWPRTCGGAVPSGEQLQQLLHVYDPIYDLLFDSEGVVTAQAATNLGSPADYPFDQVSAKYPNRVRVGFISSVSSGLDEAGRGTVQKADQFPVDGDADVYLDWGCVTGVPDTVCAEPHYQFAAPFGLGTGTAVFMSSSYVDPLGLARLVNLRYANHASEPMSNALVQTLRRELTPSLCGGGGAQPCVYQDPIAHQQLELYRLGYE